MKRFFSIPTWHWRGRVKQFEKEVYEDWAETIDRAIWVPWCLRWVESFTREIPAGSAILDVGCGTGSALRRLALLHPTQLAGLDISPKALERAREKLAGRAADLRAGDAEVGLPWPEATFDIVTMTATLHHFPDPETVVREVFRVLRPGGRLIIAEPFFFFPLLQVENLLLRIYPLNGDLHFLSQRGLRRLVTHCGFSAVAQKRAAFLARYTVARKSGAGCESN